MEIKEYTVFNEDEIKRLYTAVGWKAYTDDIAALRRGYENSLIVLGAYEEDTLIGIIRAWPYFLNVDPKELRPRRVLIFFPFAI